GDDAGHVAVVVLPDEKGAAITADEGTGVDRTTLPGTDQGPGRAVDERPCWLGRHGPRQALAVGVRRTSGVVEDKAPRTGQHRGRPDLAGRGPRRELGQRLGAPARPA